MGKLFNTDGKFFAIFTRIADLMILNILWIICCIPIFTAGAATTAMYYVTLKMVRNEESYIAKSFFRSFKDNFRQSTMIWLIMLFIGIIFSADFWILNNMPLSFGSILRYLILAFLLMYIFTLTYLFPLQAKFDNHIKVTMRNALLMSIRHLPKTLLILVITIGPSILMSLQARVMSYGILVFIMVGFALTAFLHSLILVKIFDLYIRKEDKDSSQAIES
jgi:uncharacterized membrane protein YesL